MATRRYGEVELAGMHAIKIGMLRQKPVVAVNGIHGLTVVSFGVSHPPFLDPARLGSRNTIARWWGAQNHKSVLLLSSGCDGDIPLYIGGRPSTMRNFSADSNAPRGKEGML